MMTGKKFWMTSAAVLALTATANAAKPAKEAATSAQPLQLAQASQVQMAQNTYGQNSTASGSLEDRVRALEDQLAN